MFDLSFELLDRDGSDEGSQYMVSIRNKKNYPSVIIKNLSYLELCKKKRICSHNRFFPSRVASYMFKEVLSCLHCQKDIEIMVVCLY